VNIILFKSSEWGTELAPNDERSIHVHTILKAQPGDTLKVGLLSVGTGLATVLSSGNGLKLAFPENLQPSCAATGLRLILGHVRPITMQRLFKDLASTGMNAIWVLNAGLSETSYFRASFWKDEEYLKFLIQGAMQGGLARIPEVRRFWSMKDMLAALEAAKDGEATRRYLCHPGLDAPSLLTGVAGSTGHLTVAVGPERGFTADEAGQLTACGFNPVVLGSTILRTESAALAVAVMAGMRHHG